VFFGFISTNFSTIHCYFFVRTWWTGIVSEERTTGSDHREKDYQGEKRDDEDFFYYKYNGLNLEEDKKRNRFDH